MMTKTTAKPESKMVEVLMIEDNPGDVGLIQESFAETRLNYHLHVAQDGVEALDFLRRQGKYAGVLRPDLILLDLNLPKKDGREVLSEIQQDDDLKKIPIVILTSSDVHAGILKDYDNRFICYITKPIKLDEVLKLGRLIENWFTAIQLNDSG